jgi:ATP-binding cassette subfamily F protein 3
MIADNRTFIDRFKGTFSKTDAVQSRVKMLEKVIVQVDEVDNSSLKLKFPTVRSGQYPVIVKDLTKAYGEHVVFKDANIVIERGEKVAFVGKKKKGSRP